MKKTPLRGVFWRRRGDSNPRYPNRVRQFSKLLVSATHPPLRVFDLAKKHRFLSLSKSGCKSTNIFPTGKIFFILPPTFLPRSPACCFDYDWLTGRCDSWVSIARVAELCSAARAVAPKMPAYLCYISQIYPLPAAAFRPRGFLVCVHQGLRGRGEPVVFKVYTRPIPIFTLELP